jgi:hypothetical protein
MGLQALPFLYCLDMKSHIAPATQGFHKKVAEKLKKSFYSKISDYPYPLKGHVMDKKGVLRLGTKKS